jgi:hypothetical protein
MQGLHDDPPRRPWRQPPIDLETLHATSLQNRRQYIGMDIAQS